MHRTYAMLKFISQVILITSISGHALRYDQNKYFVFKKSNEIVFIFSPCIMNLAMHQTQNPFLLFPRFVHSHLVFILFFQLKLLCLIITIVYLSLTVHVTWEGPINLFQILTILSFKGTPQNIKNPSQLPQKEDSKIKLNCL